MINKYTFQERQNRSKLGVSNNANEKEIREAFIKLAKKYNPEKSGGDIKKYTEITSAYKSVMEVINEPLRKKNKIIEILKGICFAPLGIILTIILLTSLLVFGGLFRFFLMSCLLLIYLIIHWLWIEIVKNLLYIIIIGGGLIIINFLLKKYFGIDIKFWRKD